MSSNDTETAVGSVGITYRESTPWWPEPTHPAADAPNVVLVVLDDVGFGSLGCFGAEIETPVMDALARRGLQYTNFHVTPLCSPTRAALLTGRNHHSVGMSMLSNADSGFPGKRGSVSTSAATVAEVLCSEGYNTAAFGKWHLAPIDQTTSAGPYDQWPLGRGFEHFYGFLEGITDQFYPELVQDNHRIDPPAAPEDGYHLSEDLVSHVIDYVSDQKSVAPDKPFFAYLAFGAGHTPHQAPKAYLEKYRGRYDRGWDVIRDERHARQIALGVIPEGTQLAPRNDGVDPWDSLNADERRVMARMQEAFAAMVDHADAQLGRLIEHLGKLAVLDNTVVIVMADNGASQEGGRIGCVNTIAYENGDEVKLEDNVAQIDEIGGPRANSNYPWGWAQAGNTPLKRYKQNTHAGGVRAPLIVSWPGRLDPGGNRIRGQFHSVIDITPTILEITRTRMPEVYRGVHQMPVHGMSLAYTFASNPARSKRETQYFEMYGHRAIWHDGWKAVAFHERGNSYDDDRWELYKLDEDFSECVDLAAERSDVLNALIGRWWSEAERYQVFPLDDRNFAERAAMYSSAASPRRRRRFRFYPGMERLPGGVTPLIQNRSYRIDVAVTMMDSDEGVLISHGDTNGGYTLYVRDGALHYEHNHQGTRYRVLSTHGIGTGDAMLSLDFVRIGEFRGTARLLVNGDVVGEGEISSTARYLIAWQGIFVGRDALSPVSWHYPAGFDFSGTIHHVDYTIANDAAEIAHEVFD